MASKKDNISEDSFESIVSQIETIHKKLESSDVELGEALTFFQEGIQLTKIAQNQLSTAEQMVNTLVAATGEDSSSNNEAPE